MLKKAKGSIKREADSLGRVDSGDGHRFQIVGEEPLTFMPPGLSPSLDLSTPRVEVTNDVTHVVLWRDNLHLKAIPQMRDAQSATLRLVKLQHGSLKSVQ